MVMIIIVLKCHSNSNQRVHMYSKTCVKLNIILEHYDVMCSYSDTQQCVYIVLSVTMKI